MARPHYLRAGSSEKDEGWGRKEDGKKIRFPIKKKAEKKHLPLHRSRWSGSVS
jgi:hypothetical protein